MSSPSGEGDPYGYPPTPILPELYVDLDLQVLTARDHVARWAAIVAGTREVLDRFDHLASPNIRTLTGPQIVLARLTAHAATFRRQGHPAMADWLQTIVTVLTAHLDLHRTCIDDIRSARSDTDTVRAIGEAAVSLTEAADYMATYPFPEFPPCASDPPDYPLMAGAGTCLATQLHRTPLRHHLDGVGGAAGAAEFNPYTNALYRLELATHRRLYRLFYHLCLHVGFNPNTDPNHPTCHPDIIDNQQL